jgi:hypothetical protein
MPTHSRKSSGGASQHTTQRRNSTSQQTPPKPPKHLRNNTAPEPPTLLRLPSVSSTTSARRPPASHSGHGIDNSRGPPVTLVTRSRSSQNPADFAYAQQQQFIHSGLVSPTSSHHSSSRRRGEDELGTSSEAPRPPPQQTSAADPGTGNLPRPRPPRRASTSSSRPPPPRRMASSTDESSEYDSGPRSRMEDYHAAHSGRGAPAPATPGADGDKEDLFLNIAADSAPKPQRPAESAAARVDRLKVSAPVRADNMYERIEFSKRTLYPADAPAACTPSVPTRVHCLHAQYAVSSMPFVSSQAVSYARPWC